MDTRYLLLLLVITLVDMTSSCSENEVLCPDNTCQRSENDCAKCSDYMYTCDDGSCVANEQDCRSKCSDYMYECEDGSCVVNKQDCYTCLYDRCWDGSCSAVCPCPLWAYECSDGSCVEDSSDCSTTYGSSWAYMPWWYFVVPVAVIVACVLAGCKVRHQQRRAQNGNQQASNGLVVPAATNQYGNGNYPRQLTASAAHHTLNPSYLGMQQPQFAAPPYAGHAQTSDPPPALPPYAGPEQPSEPPPAYEEAVKTNSQGQP